MKRLLSLVVALGASLAGARAKPDNWIEVRSRHFLVATNANERQGRRIADQFERMRSVFHVRFPNLQIDPAAPIIVLAVRDEKDFRTLEPQAYLAKGQLKLGGLFLRAPDKNYVLMRLDAEGDHPYKVIYHEYTHLLLGKSAEWLPLWLNEGLAEFYQNTAIGEKQVMLGEPDEENLAQLRQQRLLPLPTLFKVDQQSPYYHEENKGSIFYAESWVVTHYIYSRDEQNKTHHLSDYVELLSQNVDPIEAATRTFGDLRQLQRALEAYVQQPNYVAFKMTAATEVDDASFQVGALTAAQSDAMRADFLAYNQRSGDAEALLDRVLQKDPKNVSANETKGYLEFSRGHLAEARKWYRQAVELDSRSYLAHYYFAAMSIDALEPAADEQIESSLRAAVKLNPSFAPPFDVLAVFLGVRQKSLEEAHRLGLTAVALDPGNVRYRINVANVLLRMDQGKAAIDVLQAAAKVAKTPQETEAIEDFLLRAEEYVTGQERRAEQQRLIAEELKTSGVSTDDSSGQGDFEPQLARRDTFVAKGPHRFVAGVLKNVRCSSQTLELTVTSSANSLDLHSENYFKIQFTALNFASAGSLDPCRDLEGRPAKVEYVEGVDKSAVARVLAIELHK
jgi:tetratricopeptide (TPR) repeat protein